MRKREKKKAGGSRKEGGGMRKEEGKREIGDKTRRKTEERPDEGRKGQEDG